MLSLWERELRRCRKCGRRNWKIDVRFFGRFCIPCAMKQQAPDVRRALVRHTYGDDPTRYTAEVLRSIADAGIMDVNQLFAPAGKLSMAETRAREAAAVSKDA